MSQTGVIRAFHLLVFEEEAERGRKKRIRQFQGFSFNISSDEYNKKIEFISKHLNGADLVSVSDLLYLDYAGERLNRLN